MMMRQQSSKHLYDVARFGGNNRFYFGGRSMTGPDPRGLSITVLVIVGTSGLSLGVVYPFLLRDHRTVGPALLVVTILSFAISLIACWLTSTTDPGILPRSSTPPEELVRNVSGVRERVLNVDGRTIRVKYCETCRIWRPPHTSHCAICNNCVDRYDHHCPYVSGCIGRRNYRAFLTFITSTFVLSAVNIAAAVLHIVYRVQDNRGGMTRFDEALRDTFSNASTSLSLVVVLVALFGVVFTGGLVGFHLYLMWNNVTTAESRKRKERNSFAKEDSYRGPRAVLHLMTVKRPESRITVGYNGPRYDGAGAIRTAIEMQVDQERMVLPRSISIGRHKQHGRATAGQLHSGFAGSAPPHVHPGIV